VLPRVVHLAGEREFRRRHVRRSAASPTSGSRSSQAGHSALADDVAHKLCQRPEDVENQLAARRRGIDVLLQTAEADTASLQVADRVDEMTKRASQPVELPDDQGVTRPQLVKHLGKLQAVVEGAAGGVNKDPITGSRFQRVELQVRVLVGGGHACITKQVRHQRGRAGAARGSRRSLDCRIWRRPGGGSI